MPNDPGDVMDALNAAITRVEAYLVALNLGARTRVPLDGNGGRWISFCKVENRWRLCYEKDTTGPDMDIVYTPLVSASMEVRLASVSRFRDLEAALRAENAKTVAAAQEAIRECENFFIRAPDEPAPLPVTKITSDTERDPR